MTKEQNIEFKKLCTKAITAIVCYQSTPCYHYFSEAKDALDDAEELALDATRNDFYSEEYFIARGLRDIFDRLN